MIEKLRHRYAWIDSATFAVVVLALLAGGLVRVTTDNLTRSPGLPEASAAPPSSASVTIHSRLVMTDQWGNSRTIKNAAGVGRTLTANEVVEFNLQLNGETKTVWDATGVWTDFAAIWLESDGVLELEFTTNNGASEQLGAIALGTNSPLVIVGDDSYHTAVGGDLLAGTADTIDLIRAKEPNSTNVHLRVVLIR